MCSPACAESPLPEQRYCLRHRDNIENPSEERLDVGRITRAKRVELGISIEELTTGQGCRKKENIAVRKSREKTAGMQELNFILSQNDDNLPAGMLYTYRTCGISLGKYFSKQKS